MIPELERTPKPAGWQQLLREGVDSPAELLALLDLSSHPIAQEVLTKSIFPLRVPRRFVARMRPGDAHDPLLLQVLPTSREADQVAGYSFDPVGDGPASTRPGVLHKYAGRVLLIATGACAVHCRYCFRRHFPYQKATARQDDWLPALSYVRGDPSIKEVILSGGDPLALSDARLAILCEALATIPHVRRLRIHTRFPVVLPQRIDAGFLEWFAPLPLAKVVVLHSNHANEIDQEVRLASARLRDAGATLLNQAVLLRGINTEEQALVELSEALFDAGVLPYYLHLLDPVQGAAHFEIDSAEAARLLNGIRAALPGYLVPRVVRERTGLSYKLPLELIQV